MSIITFWNDGREQTGKTLASVAVATRMAIERNSKILLISTSIADNTIYNCFWGSEKQKSVNIFAPQTSDVAVETGVEGLFKLLTSNKLEPSIITDYTKVVFKSRLEVLVGPSGSTARSLEGNLEDFKKYENFYTDLIRIANQYYDIVIVDLDKMLNMRLKENILKMSDVNVFVLSQKLESIERYRELKHKNGDLIRNRCVPVIGKYMNKYKYNSKNIARFLQEKKEFNLLPYNLLYMAAAEEAGVVDLFLKLKNIKDKNDENYIFMQNSLDLTNNILKKLQDMQMRMG